jgi:signal transduction histidine kinase
MPTLQLAKDRSMLLARLRERAARAQFLRNARGSAAQERSRAAAGRASERRRFLSSLDQKIRAPLHNIFGYAQLLEAGIRGPLSRQQRTDISRIRVNERNLARLVEAVMNFAKWYDDDPPPLQDVVLRDALRAANREIAGSARLKGVTYHRNIRNVPPRLTVRAEPRRLVEIIRHLLENAVKFSRPGSAITVRTETVGRRVVLDVVDTGIGIHGADVEVIFHPFVRGRGAYVRSQDGVGLGLALASTLARSLDGTLSVTSRRGKGSVFRLDLRNAHPAHAVGGRKRRAARRPR